MSEYQYYDFVAIDGPISDQGLKYARGCSSSANVSRVRWQNTYSFGDFRVGNANVARSGRRGWGSGRHGRIESADRSESATPSRPYDAAHRLPDQSHRGSIDPERKEAKAAAEKHGVGSEELFEG